MTNESGQHQISNNKPTVIRVKPNILEPMAMARDG